MKPKRQNPVKTSKTERWYERQLRKIARHVGDIIGAFPPDDPAAEPAISRALYGYSEVITGWANEQAAKMVAAVNRADEKAWRANSVEMSRLLRAEIESAPVGVTMRRLQAEQVMRIKSIPLDAAQRVRMLTEESLLHPTRAKQLAQDIAESEGVSKSKATLIARTETTRASTTLTQARAMHVGSDGYIWRTSGDGDVRESHREMEGKFVNWSTPPTLDGLTGHAGCLPNCRCYPEVVVPE